MLAIWSGVNLDAHPRGSQPASQPHAGPLLAVWQVALMFCLTEEQDPWPHFSATLGPHWRWHSTQPAEERECVGLRMLRKTIGGSVRNADAGRCLCLYISLCKQRKCKMFVCRQGNRCCQITACFSFFSVRWCRLCCFPPLWLTGWGNYRLWLTVGFLALAHHCPLSHSSRREEKETWQWGRRRRRQVG